MTYNILAQQTITYADILILYVIETSSQEAQDNSHAAVGSEEDIMAQKKYRFNDDGRRLLHKILNNDLASNQLSNDIL